METSENVKMSQETVTIRKGNSSATVHLFGATLTSWKPKGEEALFLSKKSKFDKEKPIRGGVPVIFPQFGPWEFGPQHGFARKTMWSIKDGNGENEAESVTLYLEDTISSREMWNYKFLFEYTLSLISDSEMKMNAVITNRDDKSFYFTFLLHTYFSVPDVTNCRVSGLKGCTYVDKVKKGTLAKEGNDEVSLSEFTDRVYQNTPSVHKLENASCGRNFEIQKTNLPDTVVWNPWTENAKKMDDFGDDEWQHMICVEAGYVSNSYILEPGKSFTASQILKLCS